MNTSYYYQVSNLQLFIMAITIGIIAAGLITINNRAMDYLQLPVITMVDNKCTEVVNYRNGEAFTCGDVGTILRNYRIKKN